MVAAGVCDYHFSSLCCQERLSQNFVVSLLLPYISLPRFHKGECHLFVVCQTFCTPYSWESVGQSSVVSILLGSRGQPHLLSNVSHVLVPVVVTCPDRQ